MKLPLLYRYRSTYKETTSQEVASVDDLSSS